VWNRLGYLTRGCGGLHRCPTVRTHFERRYSYVSSPPLVLFTACFRDVTYRGSGSSRRFEG
jgi:hypothetical protein